MLKLALLISACVFGFLFVYFGLIVDLRLFVWLGRSVSCLPCESEASRRPETLDSPAVDEHHKMILNKFKITEIAVFKNKFKKNGTCDFTIKKQVQLPDPHATGVFLNRR